jgi:polar amino acid transport system substrate-binding protein
MKPLSSSRFGLILLIFFTATLSLSACNKDNSPAPTRENDKLAEIMARETLVIAIDPHYPPFSALKEAEPRPANTRCTVAQYTQNQMEGFDAAVATEVARRLGVEPCFVTPQWSQIISGNWSNNWDIHFGSMSITAERMQVLYFSQPYFSTTVHAFVHAENNTYQTPEDLQGKRIGVCAGCTYESYLMGNLQMPGNEMTYRILNPQIIAYANEIPALEDLSKGDGVILDALITQKPTGVSAIYAGMPLRLLPDPLYYAHVCAVVDKKNSRDTARFLNRVSDIIQEMHRDGTLSRLSTQWLGEDLTQEASEFDIKTLDQFP